MTAVCHRSVIERVKRSPLGRMCPPVCPDYTSGYLMVAHTERIVLLDDSLFVSCGLGNGSAFRRRGPLADRFMRDLGMSWSDLVGSHADRRVLYARAGAERSDAPQRDSSRRLRVVRSRSSALLRRLPARLLPRVESRCGSGRGLRFADRRTEPRGRRTCSAGSARGRFISRRWPSCRRKRPKSSEPDPEADAPDDDLPRFPTVFDALDWGERTPRPLGPNVLLAMPGLDSFSPSMRRRWRHREAVGPKPTSKTRREAHEGRDSCGRPRQPAGRADRGRARSRWCRSASGRFCGTS